MDVASRQDRNAFAARPETIGNIEGATPMTGAEYLEELRDGREVYIYGERVKDVTVASRLPQHRPHDRPPLRCAA